jgi:hypothetical protein
MQILADAAKDGGGDGIVSQISAQLYTDPQGFWDCTSASFQSTPHCSSFNSYNAFIHEGIDACNSLDEIDCATWSQYSNECKNNLQAEFGTINFEGSNKQCSYVLNGCGTQYSFPAFRHLDCGTEVSEESWAFWNEYSTGCNTEKKDDPSPPPSDNDENDNDDNDDNHQHAKVNPTINDNVNKKGGGGGGGGNIAVFLLSVNGSARTTTSGSMVCKAREGEMFFLN